MMARFQRILMVRLSAMGDVVCTLSALSALRKGFPKAYIAWAVEDGAKEVLTDHPDLDELIIVERKKWQKEGRKPGNYLSIIKEVFFFFRELQARKFDVAFDFQGNLRSGVVTLFSGAGFRVGFDHGHSKEFNGLFTNYRVFPARAGLHKIDKHLSLIHPFVSESTDCEAIINVSPRDKEYIDHFLGQDVIPDRPVVIINPGTSTYGAYKRWPLSSYVNLADELIERHDLAVVFTWGPGELEMVEEIAANMRNRAIIAPKTSIKQLTELIWRAALFIGGDTGPMHIASVAKTPVVAILGPTDPAVIGPYGNRHQVITKGLPCSPCRNRRCKTLECLRSITPNEVLEAAERLLNPKIKYNLDEW